ncbi:hypothetical protein F2P79_014481 [Pimephales promelas]|nr:hypothetical protein F2P79_014481 [Pimephales promelas]
MYGWMDIWMDGWMGFPHMRAEEEEEDRGRGWETTGAQARQSSTVCGPLSSRPRCLQKTHRPADNTDTERPTDRPPARARDATAAAPETERCAR